MCPGLTTSSGCAPAALATWIVRAGEVGNEFFVIETGQVQVLLPEEEEQQEVFEILDDETVRTMDYILRGLQLGKFDETARKVEFLGKLSGENEPKYIATLLKRVLDLEHSLQEAYSNINDLQSQISQLELYKTESEAKVNNLQNDMNDVAMAIRQLFEPKPLSKNWDMNDINNFCNRHGAMGS